MRDLMCNDSGGVCGERVVCVGRVVVYGERVVCVMKGCCV